MTTPSDLTTALVIDEAAADLLFRDAHTAHAFTDEPVTVADIEQIYDLIKWGPTSANIQPLRLTLVTSGEARERLVALMNEGNREKTRTAPMVAIASVDLDFHEHLPRTYPVWEGARERLAADPQRGAVATPQAWMQLAYFIVGIRAAGLAAGPMIGADLPGVDAAFFPDGTQRAIAVVNIGRPADDAFRPRNPRLDFAEIATVV